MKANEFIKNHGYGDSKKYINNAHKKATHIYIGFMGTASYFYQHPNLNWCEVDSRTVGWDSDRCCYDVHPPISSMFVIDELKRLVESHEYIESYGGLSESKRIFEMRHGVINLDGWDKLKQAIADVELYHVD